MHRKVRLFLVPEQILKPYRNMQLVNVPLQITEGGFNTTTASTSVPDGLTRVFSFSFLLVSLGVLEPTLTDV